MKNILLVVYLMTILEFISVYKSIYFGHATLQREHYDSGQNGNITLDLKSRILEHTSLKEPWKCAC